MWATSHRHPLIWHRCKWGTWLPRKSKFCRVEDDDNKSNDDDDDEDEDEDDDEDDEDEDEDDDDNRFLTFVRPDLLILLLMFQSSRICTFGVRWCQRVLFSPTIFSEAQLPRPPHASTQRNSGGLWPERLAVKTHSSGSHRLLLHLRRVNCAAGEVDFGILWAQWMS